MQTNFSDAKVPHIFIILCTQNCQMLVNPHIYCIIYTKLSGTRKPNTFIILCAQNCQVLVNQICQVRSVSSETGSVGGAVGTRLFAGMWP
jgi:hypothetical protein